MAAVDQADSAQFTRAEILDPQGSVLLNFVIAPRRCAPNSSPLSPRPVA